MRIQFVYLRTALLLSLIVTSSVWAEGIVSLTPVSSTGVSTISGNQIVLQGGGQQVTLEMKISGWDPNLDGVPALGGYQIQTVGFAWFSNIPGSPSVETLSFGTTNEGDGVFVDGARADFVFLGNSIPVPVQFNRADGIRVQGATLAPSGFADDGTVKYGATFIIDVPVGAKGTYIIELDRFFTQLVDQAAIKITPIQIDDAVIAVACQTSADCNDNNACTTDSCDAGTGVCANPPNFDDVMFCCRPSDGVTTALSDGNDCTSDACDASTGIVTHPNLSDGTTCGDATATECDLADSCLSGVCETNLVSTGSACGDGTNTECNLSDTCDGAGGCLSNLVSAGIACGDSSNTDCTAPDSCDGAGVCLANHVADNSVCDDGLFCNVGELCTSGICGGGNSRDCSDSLTCTTDVCDEPGVACVSTLDAGNCLVGGVCFAESDLNPANDCQSCDTAVSTGAFTDLAMGASCDDGDACSGTGRPGIGFDTCDGVGTCFGTPDPQCNDDCPFAIPALEGANLSSNFNRGPDDAEASCQIDSNNDIWFVYTALCGGDVFISTTGSLLLPSNDTVMSVFDECLVNGGVEIACDDDSGVGLQAALVFVAVAGEDYFIRIAGFEQNQGDVVLNVSTVNDCVINGACVIAGGINPANGCEACIPGVSTMDWSPRLEGATCGDPTDTECDSPDACNGSGVCETNPKPDGTACSDDGNECTFDQCSVGLCDHPSRPINTPCGDPSDSECDNPDSCDGNSACRNNFEAVGVACGDAAVDQCDRADICDGTGGCDPNFEPTGTPCDDGDICTETDVCNTDVCAGTPIPIAPMLVQAGVRTFTVAPLPAGSVAPVSLRVTSPTWTCLDKFIDVDGTLVDSPVVQLPNDWGTVAMHGEKIVPDSTYVVEAICGSFTSAGASVDTCTWGDFNCDGDFGITDIVFIIIAAEGKSPAGTLPEATDIWPCVPDGEMTITDIVAAINAVTVDNSYADTGCPLPCP